MLNEVLIVPRAKIKLYISLLFILLNLIDTYFNKEASINLNRKAFNNNIYIY